MSSTNKAICNNLNKNTNLINDNHRHQRAYDGTTIITTTTTTTANNTSNSSNDQDTNLSVNDDHNEQQQQQQQQQLSDNRKNIDYSHENIKNNHKNIINHKQQQQQHKGYQLHQNELEDVAVNTDTHQNNNQKNWQIENKQNFAHKSTDKYGKKQSNNKDKKSRRKSTSSMPLSDISDSSDLDSVHSLPVNNNNNNNNTKNNVNTNEAVSVTKNKQQQQQRLSQTAYTATTTVATTTSSSLVNIPKAQISYADIARTNKSTNLIATIQMSNVEMSLINESQNVPVEPALNNSECATVNSATMSAIKTKSNKKTVQKIDFPELVAINNSNNNNQNQLINSNTQQQQQCDASDIAFKPTISYSQRLSASQANVDILDENMMETNSEIDHQPITTTTGNTRITKAKSVEHETVYNDLDKQYPSLEMSLKRHSSAHIGQHQLQQTQPQQQQQQQQISTSESEEINFAAAAKQHATATNTDRLAGFNNSSNNTDHEGHVSRKICKREKQQKSTCSIRTQSECENPDNIKNTSSSRPAVIILNDERNQHRVNSAEFTFGDFNKEEFKFFEDEQPYEKNDEGHTHSLQRQSMPKLTALEYVARVKYCHSSPVRPQQLETCNDIETMIIAAARAAAAEKENQHKTQQPSSILSYEDDYESSNPNEYSSFTSAVSLTDQQQYQSSDDKQIPDCEMMPATNDAILEPVAIAIGENNLKLYYQSPPNSTIKKLANNTDMIVNFIDNAWKEIISNKSPEIYDGQ